MLKILTVGDLHLDKKHKVTYGDPDLWNNRPLDLLVRIIRDESPDVLFLAGDIFDTSRPPALDYSRFIASIAVLDNVFILSGNHDLSMVKEDIAFENLQALPNVTLVEPNTILKEVFGDIFSYIGVGWCDTQDKYEEVMTEALNTAVAGDIIVTHANRVKWDNDNDNSFTDAMYELARKNDVLVLSGHEHKHRQSPHFVHLGSICPQTIAELGPKFYHSSIDGLVEIDHRVTDEDGNGDVILTREDPLLPDEDKCYYVKTTKEITVEDLTMEQKDLTIDILEDFRAEAIKEGFDEKFIKGIVS